MPYRSPFPTSCADFPTEFSLPVDRLPFAKPAELFAVPTGTRFAFSNYLPTGAAKRRARLARERIRNQLPPALLAPRPPRSSVQKRIATFRRRVQYARSQYFGRESVAHQTRNRITDDAYAC